MRVHFIIVFSLALFVLSGAMAQVPGSNTTASGCLGCHNGIEAIRDPNSEMMQKIFIQSRRLGDPAGCVACHGGNAEATTKEEAHKGKGFYTDPGSP